MRKIFGKTILAGILLSVPGVWGADDAVMRAMRDELARSMKKLQLETLQKPYFVSYRVVDVDTCSVTASFGALTTSTCEPRGAAKTRNLGVEVRVGDHARDNTNFFAPRLMVAGVARPLEFGVAMPIDDNYDEIRRQLWLATDSAYKNALDLFAKKKAALENRKRTDDAPDFSMEPPVNDTQTVAPVEWDRKWFENTARTVSAVFRQTPGIADSEVRLYTTHWLTRFVSSEGTSFTRELPVVVMQVNAAAQATDGMTLTDFDIVYAHSLKELGTEAELVNRARSLAARLTKLRQASLIDKYTGPVLFDGQAAAELVFQTLGSAMLGVPRVVVDDLRFEQAYNSNAGLADRLGSRILPEFLSVTDDGTLREYQGKPLFGGYQVDEEGVKTAPVKLVDHGVLKTLLHTRALLPGTTHSTASHRAGTSAPWPTNLIISSDKSMTGDQLKAELIRLVKQRNKEYGIVVRRVSNPILSAVLNRSMLIISTGGSAAGSIPVDPLIEAYKVFPDGHEELARNLTINGMTLAAYKDIVAVSDTPIVYSAPPRITVFTPMMATGFLAPGMPNVVSAVVPSLLFDEMQLQRPSGDIPNLPFVKHPVFDK
jgi:predicted Zn-dependent protease